MARQHAETYVLFRMFSTFYNVINVLALYIMDIMRCAVAALAKYDKDRPPPAPIKRQAGWMGPAFGNGTLSCRQSCCNWGLVCVVCMHCIEDVDMRVIGDGGHAAVVRDVMSGRLDLQANWCFVAVGDNAARKREAEKLKGEYFPVLVHPSAVVAEDTKLCPGVVVMAGAVIQPRVCIGSHAIINTGATVDHDCVIGDFAHIAPGVNLCGGVVVGEGALVGVGSCAVPVAEIPAWCVVPAGSVVKGVWNG